MARPRSALLFAAALALAGCAGGPGGGGTKVATDQFEPAIYVMSEKDGTRKLFGEGVEWWLESAVDKAPPHAVHHRLAVEVYADHMIGNNQLRFRRVLDADTADLPIRPVFRERCPSDEPDCGRKDAYLIGLSDAALRRHVVTGYSVKIEAVTGESDVLTLPPERIQAQFAQVDALVAGLPRPASSFSPRLGIGYVNATANPLDDLPRGVIVVSVMPGSLAAQGGLMPGDVLLGINGTPIRQGADIVQLVNGAPPGTAFQLQAKHGNVVYAATGPVLTPASVGAPPATAATPAVVAEPSEQPAAQREIIALTQDHGTYVVPVLINGAITLNFTVDSGASDVSIPADVVSTLMRAGTIGREDFLGKQVYVLADGSRVPSQKFRIRSLKVGDLELHDVTAGVAPAKGDLLLGQSFLGRLKSWSIDNARHALVIE